MGGIQGLVGDMHVAVGALWEGVTAFITDAKTAFRVSVHEVGAHCQWGSDFTMWTTRNWAWPVFLVMMEPDCVVAFVWCHG